MASVVAIPVHDSEMNVYLDGPERRSPGPAIILMFHRGGVDAFTRGVVERLVVGGYQVAVPDVYHRSPREMPVLDCKDRLKDSEIVADVKATVEALRGRSDVAAAHIVIMGHCMGGRMALLAAGNLPDFRAVVVFYGGSMTQSWGESGATPFERLRHIRGPVIGFFGDKDVHPSPAEVDQMDRESRGTE